jgi:two-component system response regulator WspF
MRIGIVNDVQMAVEGLSRIILSDNNNQIAWVAYNGAEAVERCAQDTPDIILMDLIMPVMNGVEATGVIMKNTPCPILIVTSSVDKNSSMVFEAMGKGAMDAINTPTFGIDQSTSINDILLRKISLISIFSKSDIRTIENIKRKNEQDCREELHLIAIGSSSGGPNAIASILKDLPKDLKAAIVIVQHVDKQFSVAMAQWLNEQSSIPVRIAKPHDMPVKGEVLLACTNDHLVMQEDGTLIYQEEPINMPYRPSVDVFWYSICKYWHCYITAVLLTGMGKDGAQGMLELKRHGYYTIAQDENTSAVYGMPKAAIDIGATSTVLPLDKIAKALINRVHESTLVTNRED